MVKVITRKQQKLKSKSRNKLKNRKRSKKFLGGGEVSIELFNRLPETVKQNIKNLLSQSQTQTQTEMSVNQIQARYQPQQQFQLYDFIFDANTKSLIKVWDHQTNNPTSITAGLPGIHIYIIKLNEQQYQIIGKITRKLI
jgi:hypothetical protein